MKKQYIPIAIFIGLMLASIGFVVIYTVKNGFEWNYVFRCAMAIVVIGCAMARYFMKLNRSKLGRPSDIEKANEKHIRTAFSDREKEKKQLINAISYFTAGTYTKALDILDMLLLECVTDDDFCAVQTFRGICKSRLGLDEEALEIYLSVLARDDQRSTVWSNLGIIYQEKYVDYDKAEEAFKNAVRVDPENAFAYNNLAGLHISQENYASAVNYGMKALELKPGLYQASNALCIAYYAMGNNEDSAKYYKRSIALGVNASELQSRLREIALRDGYFSEERPGTVPSEVAKAVENFSKKTSMHYARMGIPAESGKSRIGGKLSEDAPLDASGRPMRLLCAIWLSEAGDLPDLPKKGVLRFYTSNDETFGYDREDPIDQKNFRVIYTEDEDAVHPIDVSENELADGYCVKGSYPIQFRVKAGSLSERDYRFEEMFDDSLDECGADSFRSYDVDVRKTVRGKFNAEGHKLGGYPHFNTYDIRDPKYREYDRQLLQIDSHEPYTRFGNEGTCHFFISTENLKACDFSDVLYCWDEN